MDFYYLFLLQFVFPPIQINENDCGKTPGNGHSCCYYANTYLLTHTVTAVVCCNTGIRQDVTPPPTPVLDLASSKQNNSRFLLHGI